MRSNLTLKILVISIVSVFILTYTSVSVCAQVFDPSQNPPGVKWRQITTKNFRVIYPAQLENEAQRISAALDILVQRVSASLKKEPHKISIILQNQGTTSNGFVQLAPRHSEFFTTPPQEFDSQDWLNSLAVHELRHVVQFDKLTGRLKAPFFEGLGLLLFDVILPPWFYEGDAVGIETSLTNSGRGRQPEWSIAFRTNTVSGRRYSYSKDFLGSMKDLTPGYYQLGYFMTTKLRRDKGPWIMDSLFSRISHNYLRPYNLSNSIRNYTGWTTAQLHDTTVLDLQTLWQEQLATAKAADYPMLNPRNDKVPASYLLPARTPAGDIIVIKKSLDRAPALTIINKAGLERELLKIGAQENTHFSYAADRIVWDEFRYDPRYQKRSFNVICRYDLADKTYTQLTHRSRLFAPALSPDGKIIIAVSISYSNKVSLVELDAETGSELKRYDSPRNYMLQTPRFNSTGEKLVVVAVDSQGKALYELNRSRGVFTELLPFQHHMLSRPVYAADQVIFKADYNGIDNLYRLNPSDKHIDQLTSAKFGAFNPFYDEPSNLLLFNNYQLKGYDIASVDLNKSRSVVESGDTFVHYESPLVAQEGADNVFNYIPDVKFDSKPYHDAAHLFYFHSLIPVLNENDFWHDYDFGLKIASDNLLNTLSFNTGYQFNNALKKSEYFLGFSYKRLYPILNVFYINQARLSYQQSASGNEPIPVSWRENEINADVSIPFLFNRLNKTYLLELQAGTVYTSRYDVLNRPANFISHLDFPMHYQFNFSSAPRRSTRDLEPAWAQNIRLSYRNFPLKGQSGGELMTLRSNFYFPGLLRNHSAGVSFNYQHASGVYNTTTDIPRVSGYSHLKPLVSLKNTLLLNYRFPLFYPDLELGPLAYIKRLKAGFFADFENVGNKNPLAPRTFGAELGADMNILRFYQPGFDLRCKLIIINEKPYQNPVFELGISYSY